VLDYLGRYTHRVAISNHRLVALQDGRVTFRWKDYSQRNRIRLMTLDTGEFIRRFLLQVLLSPFTCLRHYGLLSNRDRNQKLARCRVLAHNFYFKATLWPIAATRGCIVKRTGLLSANSESVFAVVPSGAKVRVCSESPVEDRFSALRAANWVTSDSGSCIVVHRLDGSFPSRRMPTEADLTALHQST
jgi:Putative transposase